MLKPHLYCLIYKPFNNLETTRSNLKLGTSTFSKKYLLNKK